MDSPASLLESVPLEIRNEIYQLVLLEPVEPRFEGKEKSSTYRNYLSILLVNKKIYAEVATLLSLLKPLVIVSCNINQLTRLMFTYSIPYISDHHITTVKYYSARMHIKFPTCVTCPKVVKSYVLHSTDLSSFCLMIRCFSLTLPHCPGRPVTIDVRPFPKLYIQIQFPSDNGPVISRDKQVELMNEMQWLKSAGRIKVYGGGDGVREMLPGTGPQGSWERVEGDELSDPVTACIRRYRNTQTVNYTDATKVAEWITIKAYKAIIADDYQLALDRFENAIAFIQDSTSLNEPVLKLDLTCNHAAEEAMDIIYFKMEIGLALAFIKLSDWEDAAYHIRSTVESLKGRKWLAKSQVKLAKRLAKRCRDMLGDEEYENADECKYQGPARISRPASHQHGGI